MGMIETVQGYIQRHQLIQPEETVLAAVSGGPDSLCLLLVLLELGYRIRIAHYDHGLRADSAREAEGVERLAGKFNLPFQTERGEVREYAREHGQTLEEAARYLRYTFLRRCAVSFRIPVIATGHTMDDQAETILMHLIRGAGMQGLQGMRPIGKIHFKGEEAAETVRVVRPLLCLTREQTEGYCLDRGYAPFNDASNRNLEHARNRIRWDLLPLLKKYNPRIVNVLDRLGEMAQANTDCMDRTANELWGKHAVKVNPTAWRFPRTIFNETPLAIRQALVRLAVQSVTGSVKDLAHRHVDLAIQFSLLPTRSRVADLALSVEVAEENDCLVFRRRGVAPPEPEWQNRRLPLPGILNLENPRWEFHLAVHPSKDGVSLRRERNPWSVYVDYDGLHLPLFIRARKNGDRFSPFGMSEPVNLNDFLSSHKVPRSARSNLPLVCDGDGILWVPGLRIRRDAAVSEKTTRWIEIRVVRMDS
jgi:tRNA(Ile)-lysidine synthase